MTQEEKDLLLKDLCARLPYGVMVNAQYKDGEGWKTEDRKLLGLYTDGQVYLDCVYASIKNIKPYLRPMSSMTEEEKNEIKIISNCKIEEIILERDWKHNGKILKSNIYLDNDMTEFDTFGDSDDKCSHITSMTMIETIDWLNSHHFDYRGLIEKGLTLEAPEGMYNKKEGNT